MIRVLKDNIEVNCMQKITPFLWFDNKAEDAVNFYLSVFKKSKIVRVSRYGNEGPGAKGTVMTVDFRIEGQKFVALNGGPVFAFSQAISFVVNCRTQKEIDRYWEQLSAGGEQQPCGWLKDRYGVSWQIVPVILADMLSDPDTEKSGRVMKAMLPMGKLDIKKLQPAYAGK
jgi:predicted 3-demethylubiquinone-9 3-methyltransferase (glyoxalase superfamily)